MKPRPFDWWRKFVGGEMIELQWNHLSTPSPTLHEQWTFLLFTLQILLLLLLLLLFDIIIVIII